ncbi:MAG: hypothetical protein ACREX0_01360 [Noviherbaspirillum sp.]
MNTEILLARDTDGYRVIQGHDRLHEMLSANNEVFVDVQAESGRAKIFRTATGLQVGKDSRYLPLKDFFPNNSN